MILMTPNADKLNVSLERQAMRLDRIRSLLERRVHWNEWPDEDRDVLVLAVFPPRGNSFEFAKSRTLLRHLFRGNDPDFDIDSVGPVSEVEADRVRADLPGLVPLGCGAYLLDQFAHLKLRQMKP